LELSSQVSKLRQDHTHLLADNQKADKDWLEEVFAAIDKMNEAFCNSFAIPAEMKQISIADLASQITTKQESQSHLIQLIEEKVDDFLANSPLTIEVSSPLDILKKIDLLFEAREHIEEKTADARSDSNELRDIFNLLFPSAEARINENDGPEEIQAKIDAAIKETHKKLQATEAATPEEQQRVEEEAKKQLESMDAALASRIGEVASYETRRSTAVHILY
jgi:hypothetical protein